MSLVCDFLRQPAFLQRQCHVLSCKRQHNKPHRSEQRPIIHCMSSGRPSQFNITTMTHNPRNNHMQGGETPVPFLLQDITSSRQLIAEITRLDHENSRLTGTIVDLNEELKQARADSQAVAENRRLTERLKDADGECQRVARGFEQEFDSTLASRDSQIRTT
jgi:hypothetical protein